MAESSVSQELGLYFLDSANRSSNDNGRSLSPQEDYNPLEDCT